MPYHTVISIKEILLDSVEIPVVVFQSPRNMKWDHHAIWVYQKDILVGRFDLPFYICTVLASILQNVFWEIMMYFPSTNYIPPHQQKYLTAHLCHKYLQHHNVMLYGMRWSHDHVLGHWLVRIDTRKAPEDYKNLMKQKFCSWCLGSQILLYCATVYRMDCRLDLFLLFRSNRRLSSIPLQTPFVKFATSFQYLEDFLLIPDDFCYIGKYKYCEMLPHQHSVI